MGQGGSACMRSRTFSRSLALCASDSNLAQWRTQAMVKRYADMEMNAKARLNELRAESKQDKADLKEVKEELVQMKLAAVHHYKVCQASTTRAEMTPLNTQSV